MSAAKSSLSRQGAPHPTPAAHQRAGLSVALIVYNEARNLRELLPQLSWADEIVVVEGGSSDDSCDVAAHFGARVITRPFDTFAQQRNHAIQCASGDWILSIDADERPTRGFQGEVRHLIETAKHDAWRVPIRSQILGRRFRFSGTQDDRPIRLFRNGNASWTGTVHERLLVSGRVGAMRNHLEHHTLPNVHEILRKIDRYTSLAAQVDGVFQGNGAGRNNMQANCVGAFRASREIFRRLIWKQGWLDGPQGWAFALLSGHSEWTLARKLRHSRNHAV